MQVCLLSPSIGLLGLVLALEGFGFGLGLCSDSAYLFGALQLKSFGLALPDLNTRWESSTITN